MILFKPCHVGLIRSGAKTVTRRKGKKRWREGAVHKLYTVPARNGGVPFAEVEILRLYSQRLGDMTEDDAKAEGRYTMQEFKLGWQGLHRKPWNPEEEVWVVEFRVVARLQEES